MMPLPNRWLSSLLLRANGELTLFDCGEGTQIALREVGWGFRRIGAICITHTHADHIAGLPGLLHAVANTGRVEPVALFGPIGTAAVVDGLRRIAPYLPYPVSVTELSGGDTFELPGGLAGRSAAGDHSLPVLAFRVEQARGRAFLPETARALGVPLALWRRLQDGQPVAWAGGQAVPEDVLGPPRPGLAVAYVTDTRPTPAIAELVAGVELLVCEGTYGSDEDTAKAESNRHMTFREAATLAREANVKRLWITHFSPSLEEPPAFAANATEVFAQSTVGSDGLTTSLTFPDA
jgi:ribonuclease Z